MEVGISIFSGCARSWAREPKFRDFQWVLLPTVQFLTRAGCQHAYDSYLKQSCDTHILNEILKPHVGATSWVSNRPRFPPSLPRVCNIESKITSRDRMVFPYHGRLTWRYLYRVSKTARGQRKVDSMKGRGTETAVRARSQNFCEAGGVVILRSPKKWEEQKCPVSRKTTTGATMATKTVTKLGRS